MSGRAMRLMLLVLLLVAAFAGTATAAIDVPVFGQVGWLTFVHAFEEEWSGVVGIGVSDDRNTLAESTLLIDKLVNTGTANRSFETGNFSGYSVHGGGARVDTQATAHYGTVFLPTKGTHMAVLDSYDADTSMFAPGATDGAYITFEMSAAAGQRIFFDWAFLAGDPDLGVHDFAFFFLQDPDTGDISYFEKLAETGNTPDPNQPVPLPGALPLLGAGLAGLGLLRRKVKG